MCSSDLVELGLRPRKRPLALATLIPALVRSRMRSASNSATMASTLNSNLPTASWGSYTDPPKLSRTSRSNLVTTRVSPSRQAASASRSPGRCRLGPGASVVDVDAGGRHAQPDQTVSLSSEILLVSGTTRIAGEKHRHGAPPEKMGWPATAQRSPTATGAAIPHFTPRPHDL